MSVDHSQVQVQVQAQAQGGETAPSNGKKDYQSPGLVCYGSVSVFTQASNSGSNEGSGGRMTASDIRLKQNIVRIDNHPLGFGVYLFDYKPEFQELAGRGRQFGVMAQEVETVMPDAVVTYPDGYKRVNYAMLGIDLSARRVH